MTKINDELLDHDEDFDVYYYEDEPFTGISYSIHPEYPKTQIYCESEHIKGKKQKRVVWHPNGQIKSETIFNKDEITLKEWNLDGQLIHEQFIENGICSAEKIWDEKGNLTENFEVTEGNQYFDMLERFRKSKNLSR
jgi:antitoxin component YwqK of YwqJK toxin-antitoxin module